MGIQYVGKVLHESGRDWIGLSAERGYAALITVSVQHDSGLTELYLPPECAMELARHLNAAAEALR